MVYLFGPTQEGVSMNDALNILGENGWDIQCQTPIVVSKHFIIDKNAPILSQFIPWIEKMDNLNEENAKYLRLAGFSLRKRNGVYSLRKDCKGLVDWRVEIEVGSNILGMTLGPNDMNVPLFCDVSVIDKYVPREVLMPLSEAHLLTAGEPPKEEEEGCQDNSSTKADA